MATLRKRRGPKGSTVWQAQIIRVGQPPQYKTFPTKGEADAWAKFVETEMRSGGVPDRTEGERLTLGQALDRYDIDVVMNKAEATQKRERQRIAYFKSTQLAVFALTRLTPRQLASYIRDRKAGGIGPNALRRELTIISDLYKTAQGPWEMPYLDNPVPSVMKLVPKLPKGRARRLDDKHDEEARLIAGATEQFRPVIKFALASAMRRGEIATMRWNQVHLNHGKVILPITKNGESREVPLSDEAVEVLKGVMRKDAEEQKLRAKRKGELKKRVKKSIKNRVGIKEIEKEIKAIDKLEKKLAADDRVFRYESGTLSQAMGYACSVAGIEDLTFHDLRHEAISRIFEGSHMNAVEIARVSGHKTMQMLSRYTHLSTEHLRQRMREKRSQVHRQK